MEGGCRTPSELRKIDDGGRFNELLRAAQKKSNGDDRRCEQILSRWVVAEFLKRIKEEKGPSREGPSAKEGPPMEGPSAKEVPPMPMEGSSSKRGPPMEGPSAKGGPSMEGPSAKEVPSMEGPSAKEGLPRKPGTPLKRPRQIVVSDNPSVALKKRPRLDNETTIYSSPRELANLPRSTIEPGTSSSDQVEPELEKKKERKKAIKYSPEQVKQLKQKGMNLPLPEEVRVRLQELGGSGNPVRLVIKNLFQTDLSDHHGRFNLPETKFVKAEEGGGFLTEEEWRALNNKKTMKVRLVGPMCTEPTCMILKRWDTPCGSVPVLTSGWGKFLKKYKTEHKGVLRKGDGVQLWATRSDGNDLLLALQVIYRAPAVVDDIE